MPQKTAVSKSEKGDFTSSSKLGKEKKVRFPTAQERIDYTQPVIIKNSKVTFGEKLGIAKEQHKDRLDDLILEMHDVKKENERLRRQQEDTVISMDIVNRMKDELDRARTTKAFLTEDIDKRKEKCEKMEAETFELNMKLESLYKKISEFRHMKRRWEETSETLAKTEEKCDKMSRTNKNLRLLLIKHHIDPKTVDFESGRPKRGRNTDKSPKSILKHPESGRREAHKEGTHSYTHVRNASRKLSKSMEDLRIQNDTADPDEIRRRHTATTRKAMGRGPPSYLGHYSSIQHTRLQNRVKDMVRLPKLAV